MIKTTAVLKEEFASYREPMCKISRMAKEGLLLQLVRGVYETDPNAPGHCLAGSIYGPSYLSFEYALAWYGMIPERAWVYTSATIGKKKKKEYTNAFGTYTYRDVPDAVFALEVKLVREGDYAYWIASPEKALCDALYAAPAVSSQRELKSLLFEDMRIDEEMFSELDGRILIELSCGYACTNTKLLGKIVERMKR